MKRNEKGFTLIELVTVIAILGVLAAMTVPKFFALQGKAKIEVENQIIGSIRAGLETYAANEIVFNGAKVYPVDTSTSLLTDILNPVPSGWDYTGSPLNKIRHIDGDTTTWTYTRPSAASYTIVAD